MFSVRPTSCPAIWKSSSGLGRVAEQLGQELEAGDPVDRIAEVLDAAGEVENDH